MVRPSSRRWPRGFRRGGAKRLSGSAVGLLRLADAGQACEPPSGQTVQMFQRRQAFARNPRQASQNLVGVGELALPQQRLHRPNVGLPGVGRQPGQHSWLNRIDRQIFGQCAHIGRHALFEALQG